MRSSAANSGSLEDVTLSCHTVVIGHRYGQHLQNLTGKTMWNKSNIFRLMTIFACLAWGFLEFLALQRARFVIRRLGQ